MVSWVTDGAGLRLVSRERLLRRLTLQIRGRTGRISRRTGSGKFSRKVWFSVSCKFGACLSLERKATGCQGFRWIRSRNGAGNRVGCLPGACACISAAVRVRGSPRRAVKPGSASVDGVPRSDDFRSTNAGPAHPSLRRDARRAAGSGFQTKVDGAGGRL